MKTIYVALLASFLSLSIGCGPTPPREKGSRTVGARMMAEDFIKNKLKAPASAEFSGSSETTVKYDSATDSYNVIGWVDAQNSFGAKLRSMYVCTVRNTDGDTWQGRDCRLIQE